ncbi:MAG: hypothetical protein KDJ29_06720 [Hyphomicrobiales bacterium]|nr:hypothetical protein [Hyphomicrobiales bacterium]
MAHALREQTHDDAARSSIADDLVNPASGIANDYLNLFNEIVMLIEQLPTMPELIDDIKAWKPTSYEDYFIHSPLPGRESAIEAYQRLDMAFRREFEQVVAELDQQATGVVATIRLHMRAKGDSDLDGLEAICSRGGNTIRETLERAVAIVNEGLQGIQRYQRAKLARLEKIRQQSKKDLEEFYNKPIWRRDEDED